MDSRPNATYLPILPPDMCNARIHRKREMADLLPKGAFIMYRVTLRIPEEMKEEIFVTLADLIAERRRPISLQECIEMLLKSALEKYWENSNGHADLKDEKTLR
jgi:hypothetical protein